MYKITLINTQTNQPHEVAGSQVIVFSDSLDHTAEQLMRNRDTKLFRLMIERCTK